ncbi:MAG: glyoxalase [Pseudonocardia sp.]|jgi:hypothetical protein|nr:glyoxalase [Pseudonocardia sp.]MDT7613517.1 hypothetical protein [Pseudonocardiales bacterium]
MVPETIFLDLEDLVKIALGGRVLVHDYGLLESAAAVQDVQTSIDFYTTHLEFTLRSSAAPAFADVTRGHLRQL